MIKELRFEGEIYQDNVSEYESGKRQLPLSILLKYAQNAGVCLDIIADDNEKLIDKLPSKPKHK